MIKLHKFKLKKNFNEVRKNDEVIIEDIEFKDLLEASSSSLEFWNNDVDDKTWNNA